MSRTAAFATTTATSPTGYLSSLCLFAVVALCPLLFGSTDIVVLALWCVVLGISLVFAPTSTLRYPHFVIIVVAGAVSVACAFVLHEQLSARPLVAYPHPLWADAGRILATDIEPSVSIARNQPILALGAPLACMLALMCGCIICADRHRARQLIYVIALSGLMYAIFGIGSYLIDPTKVLWREKEAHREALTAVFLNRNTAATYFGSCAIIWSLISAEQIQELLLKTRAEARSISSGIFWSMPRRIVLSIFAMFVCLIAVFMTHSRAGIVLTLAALIAAPLIYFRKYLDFHRRGIMVLLAGAILAVLLLVLMGQQVIGRLSGLGLADQVRMETYRSTLRLIGEHPWFGTGLGTFPWSFPEFRSADVSVWGIFDRAHNTLLEIAAELGVPFTGIIVVSWIGALCVLVRGMMRRRRELIVPFCAFFVSLLALCHSLVDFSLQIPGYAIVVFSLLGAGLAQSFNSVADAAER
jgi:O-antigen ligase